MIYMTHCARVCTTERLLVDDIPYPQHAHIIADSFKNAKTGVVYPPHKLLDAVRDPSIVKYVRNTQTKGKTAFLFAAGNQGWMSTQGRYDKNPDTALHNKVKLPFITLSNIYAGRVAAEFGEVHHISTDATACASSLKVLMDVQNLINNFGFTRVIVLSGEDAVNNLTLEFFGEARASLQYADEEHVAPSAFDDVNMGFHLGQGAVLAVFESEPTEVPRPIARLLGAYTASETYANPLGQRADGFGYKAAIAGALHIAKLDTDVVQMVKTHGTGTPVNNAAEKSALTDLLPEFIATSYKQRVGHTMGASGLLETSLLLDDIADGFVPAIPNRTEYDPVFLSDDASPQGDIILSLAAGMGNVFSAAVFSTDV
jgi:3-oxoacyl-(acyl-carrier-protein) synthase